MCLLRGAASRGNDGPITGVPQQSSLQSLLKRIKHRPCPGSVNICPPIDGPSCHVTLIQSLLHMLYWELLLSTFGCRCKNFLFLISLFVCLFFGRTFFHPDENLSSPVDVCLVSLDYTMWLPLAGVVLLMCVAGNCQEKTTHIRKKTCRSIFGYVF